MTVSVHVIGGFLGAGKTSAVRALLAGPLAGRRVAVVVHDFGESALDEVLLADSGHAMAEIRGECVCCTAPEGFIGAVGGLLEDPTLEAIVVEPTGLARPADLIDTLRRAPYADRIALGPLVVLCDPAVLLAPHRADLRHQAAHADVLVANRVDLATPEQRTAFDAWASELWPAPLLRIETTYGQLGNEVLSWPDGVPILRGARVSHAHQPHHHQHALSRAWSADQVFHRGRLLEVLERCAADPEVLRAKGLMRTQEGWIRVDIAGGRVHDEPTDWRRDSRLDVISEGELEAWGESVQGAILTDAERAVSAEALELGLPDGASMRFDRSALMGLPDGVADVSEFLPGRQGTAARLSSLLARVEVSGELDAVVVAADGYTTPPAPLQDLEQALLIHSLDDQPLPAGKGGPIRLMVPADAGPGGPCANVKGVVRISLRSR